MILYVFQWLVVTPVSVAQGPISSNIPNCTDDEYNWTFNSMGQSPCYVADALAVQSLGQPYPIAPLSPPGAAYSFSSSFSNGTCYCNTVWYSLISACAICQNGTWLTWPNYSQNCNQTYVTKYPDTIPSNTSVPSWAYLNVTETDDAFDPNAAYNRAVGSSSTVSASFTSTVASTSASSSSNSSSSHSSKTVAGAIAGGVIGCVVGGALVSALLFWLYTKRRASRPDPETSPHTSEHKLMDPPPSTAVSSPPPSTNTPAIPSPPPWTDTTAIPSPPPLTDSPTPVQQIYQDALQKTYDPDDIPTSSTFPRFRDESPRGLLPNTEHHWGQVGQYYADIPEL